MSLRVVQAYDDKAEAQQAMEDMAAALTAMGKVDRFAVRVAYRPVQGWVVLLRDREEK